MTALAPWEEAPFEALARIDVVLTDVDDTLTHEGRLHGATLDAIEMLERAGVRVVPVTAASAGWGSAMISMWPVAAVIAENGGVAFVRREVGTERRLADRDAPTRMNPLRAALLEEFPWLVPADDQPYRETSLAFRRPESAVASRAVIGWLEAKGAAGILNSLWLLAFPGSWDKRSAALGLLAAELGVDPRTDLGRMIHVGDSENDQALFSLLPNSVGVSTVVRHDLTHWPRWITRGPGGVGFVEVARRLIRARTAAPHRSGS